MSLVKHQQQQQSRKRPITKNGIIATKADAEKIEKQRAEKKRRKDEEMGESIRADMEDFLDGFPAVRQEFLLVDKIGEGTFSSVYKAIDLKHKSFDNSLWHDPANAESDSDSDDEAASHVDENGSSKRRSMELGSRRNSKREKRPLIALKRIYTNSSPQRILNEIKVLHELRFSKYIAAVISAFRHQDQVVVALPYFRHDDFREYFLKLPIGDFRLYFRNLFLALRDMHECNYVHRDVKPSNFLYNIKRQRGCLVDFGLAEIGSTPYAPNELEAEHEKLRRKGLHPPKKCNFPKGYIKNDQRPSIRVNRAGTRGFRAPEVLFKVHRQTIALDVWSVGVTLLCFLTRMFPFFQSNDDVEALIELSTIFGTDEMKKCAGLFRRAFDTTIPSIKSERVPWALLIKHLNPREFAQIPTEAIDLLDKCMTLDPSARITCAEAVNHPYLNQKRICGEPDFERWKRDGEICENSEMVVNEEIAVDNEDNDDDDDDLGTEDGIQVHEHSVVARQSKRMQQGEHSVEAELKAEPDDENEDETIEIEDQTNEEDEDQQEEEEDDEDESDAPSQSLSESDLSTLECLSTK